MIVREHDAIRSHDDARAQRLLNPRTQRAAAEELLKEDKSFGKNPKAFEKALKSRLEARGHKMNPLMLLLVKLVLKAILELL